MISCRVSRREYKAQQGKLSVHLPAERPLLRLHFQVVFLGRGESGRVADVARGASGIFVFCQAGSEASSSQGAAEAGNLQGWRRDRSGEINHAPPNTTDDGATGHDM